MAITMKKNGYTLIELLAVLALMGMVMGIIFSVFNSGLKQGENTKKDIFLQQEANYVATALRNTHFNKTDYTLLISNNSIVLDGVTISDKYQYDAKIKYKTIDYINGQTITINNSSPVIIEITFSKNGATYKLRTTLSRGV
jgi:prepilin-type N-terminal cleavage/methylation domain-containing protein